MSLLRLLFLSLLLFSTLTANPKVTLFNDTSAWYHWGCTGTSTALKETMQKLGFEIEAFPIQATYSLLEVPNFENFDSFESFDSFRKANPEILKKIQNNDLVVITGEGTIHDLRSGPRALLYLAHISKRFLNKHVEIINHSAYPKDDPLLNVNFLNDFLINEEKEEGSPCRAQLIYKTIYNELDFIAIREPISYEVMARIGVSSTLSFDCLPLYIRDHYCNPKKEPQKNVVVAGSVAFTETGAEKLCRYLENLNKRGYEIKLLAGALAFPSCDDEAFIQFMKLNSNAPLNVVIASSMEEWLDTINNASFLVSGRFHHTIAAFCLQTPFIALNSNTFKLHAICSMFGKEHPLLFSDPHLLENLLLRTETIFKEPFQNNEDKINEICLLAEKNFEGLKKFLQIN